MASRAGRIRAGRPRIPSREPTLVSPSEAADLIRDRDRLGLPLGPGHPAALLHALGERESFDDLRVFAALLTDLYRLFTRPGVQMRSGFYGPVERGLVASGHDVHFVPSDFRRFAPLFDRLAPRVMATNAAPPDEDGWCSLALHAGASVTQLEHCGRDPDRVLMVEINPALPRTRGLPPEHRHALHVDQIDVLIEGDRPVFELPEAKATEIDHAIAEHASHFVQDGCTLQTGIGAIPSQVAGLLAHGSGGDYGIHSEMFTTGLMKLHQAGKVSNRKGIFDGVSIATFAAGTRELYDWLHENDEVRFLPVEEVNTPSVIARNRRMVSLNGALEVDLAGQVVADAIGGRQYSGIGGHEDFVAGAAFAEMGRSLICLESTAVVGGRRISRIVSSLHPGAYVTTPRHQVDVIVTEYGAAEVFGLTVQERRDALIAIAHPDFRDGLREAAAAA